MPTGNCLLHQQTVLPVEMPKCLEKKEKKYKHEAHSHYPRRHRAEVLPQRPLPGSHAGSRGHFHVLSLKQCRRSLRGTWFFPHGSALGRDSRQRGS